MWPSTQLVLHNLLCLFLLLSLPWQGTAGLEPLPLAPSVCDKRYCAVKRTVKAKRQGKRQVALPNTATRRCICKKVRAASLARVPAGERILLFTVNARVCRWRASGSAWQANGWTY